MEQELTNTSDAIDTLCQRLVRWLRADALPLWDRYGVDRVHGGFFETITVDAQKGELASRGDVRRGRVVARQMFVFDVGHRMGWKSTESDPVYHGCEFLFSRMHRGDGLFYSAVHSGTWKPQSEFSLYEHAFYLFALARVNATAGSRFPVSEAATHCLRQLRSHWGKSNGGFEEANPSILPLKSNPHMHLLEAAIAWIDAGDDVDGHPWALLANEMVNLCLTHFIDPRTGALLEYFDQSWRPIADERGRVIEPGHQFEWAWLLMKWAQSEHCGAERSAACHGAARRLVEIGESSGVDPHRGVAFNEIWDDMKPKDTSAKLWPQTERVKASCAMLELASTKEENDKASRSLLAAIQGLSRYLDCEPAGLWREVLLADDRFTSEACRASSFYHIVCAIETLCRTLAFTSVTVL